jgi:hypothetical protein
VLRSLEKDGRVDMFASVDGAYSFLRISGNIVSYRFYKTGLVEVIVVIKFHVCGYGEKFNPGKERVSEVA